MVDMHEDPIEVVPSRHRVWRSLFAAERDRVESTLADAGLADRVRRIEHVGSTAVPGLAAKDVVDLDVVVEDGSVPEVATAIASGLGGTRYENSSTWQPVARRHDGQRFNVHAFAASDDGWKVSVATAAALRERPALREEYERLKREAAAGTDDLGEYSTAKTAFVERLLEAAREDASLSFGFEVPEL